MQPQARSSVESRYPDLAPDIIDYVTAMTALYSTASTVVELTEQRAAYDRVCADMLPLPAHGVAISDFAIDGPNSPIRVRLFIPDGADQRHLVLYLHGGGYYLGSLDSHAGFASRLAINSRVRVLAADYRLAPEHRFPAAFEDSVRVFQALQDGDRRVPCDPGCIVVVGDSAGGNLAAAVTLAIRDQDRAPPAAQVLIYPPLGARFDRGSFVQYADAPMLSTQEILFCCGLYCGAAIDIAPEYVRYAAPLTATDFRFLPPATLLPAAIDPLYDDSIDYAEALREAGVPVSLHIGYGLVHGCLHAFDQSASVRAWVHHAFAAIRAQVRQ